MSERNRIEAPERMRNKNPMRNSETREIVSQRLKAIGHKPKFQGGNGKPLPDTQVKLLKRLSGEWTAEFVVQTHTYRGSGLSTHYKIDIANPNLLIAIEVDGRSHCCLLRQSQDLKKEKFLKSKGWRVLRFTNYQINADIEAVLNAITTISGRTV